MIRRVLFAVTALLAFLPGATRAKAPTSGPGYHLVKKLAIGGEGGWDYLTVDGAARRLYVSRSTRVQVFDADSGAPVGEIPNTAGVHGVALVRELDRGFTSNGRASTVTVFELKSLKMYFWSYRNEGAFHEKVTNTILDDIVRATDPRFIRITAKWNVRGGIWTNVVAEHRKKGWKPQPRVELPSHADERGLL